MAIFRYEAIDGTGKTVRGAMDATDEQAVAQRLLSMGFTMQSAIPTGAQAQSAAAASSVAAPRTRFATAGPASFPVSIQPVVSLRTLSRFYRQLSTLVRSGIPISSALLDLQASTANRKLKQACGFLKDRTQAGDKISTAMALHPEIFPVHSVGLIWAGEQGGYLDVALDETATDIEQEAKSNLLASIGWGIMKAQLFFFILSLPVLNFAEILKVTITSTGDPPAIMRQMAVMYGQGFVRYCIPSFIAWIVGSYAWGKIKRIPSVRRSIDGALLSVPAWGTMHRERARQRFLRTLYQQYNAGVPPAQAWSAASMSVRNSELASRLRALEPALRTPGGTLQQALAQSGVFTQEDAAMLGSGEKAGAVPETLDRLSSYHSDTADHARTAGKIVSWHLLILWLIIPTGILAIAMAASYSKFFKFLLDYLGI